MQFLVKTVFIWFKTSLPLGAVGYEKLVKLRSKPVSEKTNNFINSPMFSLKSMENWWLLQDGCSATLKIHTTKKYHYSAKISS